MKKIILAIVLALVVAAGLLLLAQVHSHEGYFSPVYSPHAGPGLLPKAAPINRPLVE